MPNWCHNKLSVGGPSAAVRAFAEKVAVTEGENATPLTFTAHVPEPSQEVFDQMRREREVTCNLCGGRKIRPVNAEEAKAYGARWQDGWEDMEWVQKNASVAVDDRPACNLCRGTGRALPRMTDEPWMAWRYDNWGCKWDASFDGPGTALGTDEANVDATVAMQGRVMLDNTVLYTFDTPWGPPIEWLRRAAAQEPELAFNLRFGEVGNDFAGEVRAHRGFFDEKELPVEEVLEPEEMWF